MEVYSFGQREFGQIVSAKDCFGQIVSVRIVSAKDCFGQDKFGQDSFGQSLSARIVSARTISASQFRPGQFRPVPASQSALLSALVLKMHWQIQVKGSSLCPIRIHL